MSGGLVGRVRRWREWDPVAVRKHLLMVGLVLALVVSALASAAPGTRSAFSAKIGNSTNTARVAAGNTCAWTYATGTPTPYFLYPLSDNPVKATAVDTSGNSRTGAYAGTPAHSTSNSCARDGDGSTTFNGTDTLLVAPTQQSSPQVFSLEIWFKTSVASGGYLIGLNGSKTGGGSMFDRHLYINSTGYLVFGVYSAAVKTVTSTTVVTNGAWHHAVGTFTSAGGMYLYLDGQSVGTPITTAMTAETDAGYWRIGYSSLSGWPGQPGNTFFGGQLGYAAVYMSVLSATTVSAHYSAGV